MIHRQMQLNQGRYIRLPMYYFALESLCFDLCGPALAQLIELFVVKCDRFDLVKPKTEWRH